MRNPEVYNSLRKDMLRFARNIIIYQIDHKIRTLDKVYNKIDKSLPGLFQF